MAVREDLSTGRIIRAWRRTTQWAQGTKTAIVIGVFLVAVPTAFQFFPELGREIPTVWRAVVTGAWLLFLILVVYATALRDDRFQKWVESTSEERRNLARLQRTTAFNAVLRSLLDPSIHGIPACYEFTVYTQDPTDSLLRPVYPAWEEDGDDVRVFEPGNGATGTAWEREQLIVVKGDAVSNTKHGLSERQQEFWSDHVRAVSYPLYIDLSRRFGVLTALSKESDDYFDSVAGQALFKEMAGWVAVVLLTVAPAETVTADS